MNYEKTTLLKTISVNLTQQTSLGNNILSTIDNLEIFLPAGTLLESGNVRVPYDIIDSTQDDLKMLDTNVTDTNLNSQNNCNNQNIIFFNDKNDNIYSNIPKDLPQLDHCSNQVCYCKIPENSHLQISIEGSNMRIKTDQDHWCSLNKGTKVKISANKELEFRVNGNWHRIKLIKDEYYKI